MARVEILMLTSSNGMPTFTVNTAVTEVNTTQAAAPNVFFGYFANGVPNTYFAAMDHIKLLSLMVRLPYCFRFSTGRPYVMLSWEEPTGPSETSVVELGGTGWMNIPLSNVEFDIGGIKAAWFAGVGVTAMGQARIGLKAWDMNISMIGVPASLHQAELNIQLALKVLHTEDMLP